MSLKIMRVGGWITFLITATVLLSQHSYARPNDCAQVMERVDTEIHAFDAEAQQQGVDFMVDSGVSAAIEDAKKIIIDQVPDHGSAQELETKEATIQAWGDLMSDYRRSIEDLEKCVVTPQCSLIALVRDQNDAFRRWVESFASKDTQTALNRVHEARALLQDYTRRLGSSATDSMSAAVGCMDSYIEHGNSTPVDLTPDNTPTAAPAARPRGPKMSRTAAAVLIGSVVVGGTVLAAASAAQINQQQDCSAEYLGTGIGSLVCSSSFYDPAQCQANETKARAYCQCEGYSTYITTSTFGDFGIVAASQVCR